LELADRTLSAALTRSDTIDRAYAKAQALMEIAPRLARREQAAKASEVLFKTLTTLAMIADSYHQSHALITLADKYIELGQEAGEREQAVLEEITAKL
jgi:hypothetical protein